jgi:hypothetical protein
MGGIRVALRGLRGGALVSLIVLVVGCGEAGPDSPENESPSGPIFILKDGGPIDPVPARAAVALSVLPRATGACPATGIAYSLPSGPDALQAIRLSGGQDRESGEVYRAVDGEPDTRISCEVRSSGSDAFTFAGSIRKSGNMIFTASGTISGQAGTMSLSEWDIASGLPDTVSDEACTLDLTGRYVAPGAIWADFRCPQFGDELVSCRAEGTFVFENCQR